MLHRDVADYLTHCKARRLSYKTITMIYPHALNLMLQEADAAGIDRLDQLDQRFMDRFSVALQERRKRDGQPISPASIHSYTRVVNGFLAWAKREGEPVTAKAQLPKLGKRLVEVLSREEITKLEDSAPTERDKLIIRLLANTGIRVGELTGLTRDDIKDSGRAYSIKVSGKGERDRMVALTKALYMRLRHYADRGRPAPASSEHIFLSLRSRRNGLYEPITPTAVVQLLKGISYRAGITRRVYPHLLRHSFATYALTKNMNPVVLAKVLGHADLSMIQQVYAHLSVTDTSDAMLRLFSEA